jgi:hypothetical protein
MTVVARAAAISAKPASTKDKRRGSFMGKFCDRVSALALKGRSGWCAPFHALARLLLTTGARSLADLALHLLGASAQRLLAHDARRIGDGLDLHRGVTDGNLLGFLRSVSARAARCARRLALQSGHLDSFGFCVGIAARGSAASGAIGVGR